MKYAIYLIMLFNATNIMSQQLDYYPEQRPGVSDEDYKYGIRILKETYENIKSDGGAFYYADYWNIALAFVLLKEDDLRAKELLHLSQSADLDSFSKIFIYNDELKQENKIRKLLSEEEYQKMLDTSKEAVPNESDRIQKKDKKKIKFSDDYKESLISTFHGLLKDHKRYRTGNEVVNINKQVELDHENIEIIDQLYAVHKCYIGRRFVGEKYQEVMCEVILHGHLKAMEKYLPVIHLAALKHEVDPNSLARLIDRIYVLKHGFQIYGTQSRMPLGPLTVIQEVVTKYDLSAVVVPGSEQLGAKPNRMAKRMDLIINTDKISMSKEWEKKKKELVNLISSKNSKGRQEQIAAWKEKLQINGRQA